MVVSEILLKWILKHYTNPNDGNLCKESDCTSQNLKTLLEWTLTDDSIDYVVEYY